MKKNHIVAGIMILVAIGILISVSGEMSSYYTFADAERDDQKVRIVGLLAKDKAITYDPEVDPNYFSFFMKDNNDEVRKVVLLAAKPQDFERSEQIVVTGNMIDGDFIASDMLLKCPSKYKEDEIFIRSNATASSN